VTALGIILVIPHFVLPATPGPADYYFHWLRYQRIVAEVRADDLSPGDCKRYSMRHPDLYLYLEALPDEHVTTAGPLYRTGEVQAHMNAEESLALSIVTADHHHAGTFGYLLTEDRGDPDQDGCLQVLGNTTRSRLNRNWETFRWD